MYPYIYEMKRRGSIVIASSEAEEQLANESLDEIPEGIDEPEVDETEPQEEVSEEVSEDSEIIEEDTPSEEPSEPVNKIQTLDILTAVMNKFDSYMADSKINWDLFINQGRITSTPNFILVDDLYNLLNNTLDEKQFEFVAIFNKLFNNMTDTSFTKKLANYGREKYGKPFIAEGLALLLYELAIDWSVFLSRYFKELPNIQNSEDSFVRKFPNLRFLTYIAKLFNDSSEFGKLIKDEKAIDLLTSDTKYSINSSQAKKKPRLYRAKAESISYYASLIRYNYADIMAGACDKLAIVVFLNNKCTQELHNRLPIITELIRTVTAKDNTVQTPEQKMGGINTKFITLDNKAIEILKNRSEARIILESNEANFPMKII